MPLTKQPCVEGHHGNFTQDGKYFFLLNRCGGRNKVGNEVAVFHAQAKKLVADILTGSSGVGHAYNTPDGKYAVTTNYGNNLISIIETGSWKLVKDMTIGKGRMDTSPSPATGAGAMCRTTRTASSTRST